MLLRYTGSSLRTSILFLGLSAVAAVTHADGLYTIRDLGIFTGGVVSVGQSINGSGQVTGRSDGPTNAFHAFRTSPTGSVNDAGADLGFLSGATQSFGQGINASGQVAGYSGTPNSGPHAFRTTPTGTLSDVGADLGVLSGGTNSWGMGINNSGQVVGYGDSTGFINHAFRTTATGTLSDVGADLGVLPGGKESQGRGINGSGQITGNSDGTGFSLHAFRTTATGTLGDGTATDLGVLPGDRFSIGYAINNSGQVTGYSSFSGLSDDDHAFLTTATGTLNDGTAINLGVLSGGTFSDGYGINNLGQVVGTGDGTGFDFHAFLYTSNLLGMQDLNRLLSTQDQANWSLRFAFGINDSGQITGIGTLGGIQGHAFVLTPVTPEPGTYALLIALGVSSAGLLYRHARRR